MHDSNHMIPVKADGNGKGISGCQGLGEGMDEYVEHGEFLGK